MEPVKYNFKNYKNFDFKNNWKKIIKPYLTNEKVIKSIERAIIGYTHNKIPWPDCELYELKSFYDYFEAKHKYIANYSSNDSFTHRHIVFSFLVKFFFSITRLYGG